MCVYVCVCVAVGRRWVNPGSMKQVHWFPTTLHIHTPSPTQALVEGAVRLPNLNIYEQGSGRINLPNSMAILQVVCDGSVCV